MHARIAGPARWVGLLLAAGAAAVETPQPPTEAFPAMREAWDREPPPVAGATAHEPLFRAAERNGRRANEAFYRSRRFVDGWLAHADPATGLIPRNLRASVDYWNGRDSGADNYPFMVLTAAMTDRPLFEGRMLDMLRTETRLTCRIDRLPDDYSFSRKGWRRETADLETIVFEGAEYVKDGLLPIAEWLGPSPWSERAIGIVDDIWKNARIETPSGALPTRNFEVNGDLLQACSRLFWFTGDRKYLDWAIRLGDHYLLGDRHPTRNMNELKLGDHACEVINGLSELYVAVSRAEPAKREAYRKPLHELYDRILAVGVNAHGLMYSRINPKTGAVIDAGLTDNWGYNYDGLYTVFLLDGTAAYREAVRKALGCLKENYTGQGGLCQSSTADGYADSIEGAITLYNRERVESATDWIDTEIGTMWSKQKSDGVIEGWHGDGNSARTSLMYALWKTQGVTIRPWRADVRFGAVENGGRLLLTFAADKPWQGIVIFDRPRHREFMKLPLDYPRINQFPEWFTAEAGASYAVREAGAAAPVIHPGRALREGLPLTLAPGVETRWIVTAAEDGNWPRWRGPNDNAVVEQALPVGWSDTSNVVWKTALPGRGCSTPVVWEGRIVLTAPVDGRDAVLAFDASGRELWRTVLDAERPARHRSASGSNPSPVTDGRSVWVYFKSGTLAALTLDGALRWKTNLQDRFGPDALVWDIGTSPALTEKDVVVNVMNGTNSHLAAFDRATGAVRWSVPRNYPCAFETDQGYTTPIVLPFAGRESLLVWNAEHLTVHDAADGATLWDCGGLNPEARSNWPPVSSPVILGDTVVLPYGRGKLLHGLRLAGRGDVTGKALLWSRNDTGSYVPTPLAYKGKVFLLRDRNEVDCIDPATGRTEWTGLFEKNATAFYASPVIAGGRLYAAREDGVIFVARIDGGFELLARNAMGEKMWATPVPFGRRLLIRGERTLFCIGAPPP